jgi:hypothetical protein
MKTSREICGLLAGNPLAPAPTLPTGKGSRGRETGDWSEI